MELSGRRGAGSTAAAIALIALAVLAPTAQARPGKSPVFKTGAIITRSATASASADQSVATATARCPATKRGQPKYSAVGGGFQETPPSLASEGFVFRSQLEGRSGWTVATQVRDTTRPANEPVSITAYVYCLLGAQKPTTVSTTASTGGGDFGLTPFPLPEARCPKSSPVLLGGGFSFSLPDNFQNYVLESHRVLTASKHDGWTGALFAGPTVGQITIEGYCVASRATKLLPRKTQTLQLKTMDTGGPTFTPFTVDAACKNPKSSPSMGGFIVNGARLTASLFVYESYRVGKKWRVSGSYQHSASDTNPVVLASLAYC
jgi:hypothetical protein